MNVFRILGSILFYIKMYLGSLLVNFDNMEPLLYIIGQVLEYQKHPGSEGDIGPDILKLVCLYSELISYSPLARYKRLFLVL